MTALTPDGRTGRSRETDSPRRTGRMSEHGAARQPDSAEDWDERYSGELIWSGNPNVALPAEVAELSRVAPLTSGRRRAGSDLGPGRLRVLRVGPRRDRDPPGAASGVEIAARGLLTRCPLLAVGIVVWSLRFSRPARAFSFHATLTQQVEIGGFRLRGDGTASSSRPVTSRPAGGRGRRPRRVARLGRVRWSQRPCRGHR